MSTATLLPTTSNGSQASSKTFAPIALRASENDLAILENAVAQCGMEQIAKDGHFTKALKLASGIQMLTNAITPAIMVDIMALQGCGLGFKTDKVYDQATVKMCLIEALLLGAYPVGNEFNIIAGRPYLTKEFYTRKLREFPGLSFVATPGVPATVGDKGALVPFTITWSLNGRVGTFERLPRKQADGSVVDERIVVRVNSGMGADAIIGKATRKAYKALYDSLSGRTTPDGEADEPIDAVSHQPAKSLDALTKRLTATPEPEAAVVQTTAPPAYDLKVDELQTYVGEANDLETLARIEKFYEDVPGISADQLAFVRKEIKKRAGSLKGGAA